MIEILLLDSYLKTFISLSFNTSAITNIDYVDVLLVFFYFKLTPYIVLSHVLFD